MEKQLGQIVYQKISFSLLIFFYVRLKIRNHKGEAHLVMGPGQIFFTRVGSGQFFVGRVGLCQPFMVWVWIWKICPKNIKFFNFLPFGSKKISSGRVGKYPGQRRVGLLFIAGQK